MTDRKIFDLSGRVSLVTGAGSGLGRVFCEAMAEYGSAVVCVDINGDWAKDTASMIKDKGGTSFAIKGDVSNQREVKRVFEETHEAFGRLDILFNNAGVTAKGARLHEIPYDHWERIIRIDLTGVFLCMQEGIRLMLPQKKGSIINTSSAAGLSAVLPYRSHYSAAKAGVISLTKVAAREYGPDGIRVNAIAPGMFAGTRLGESAGSTKEQAKELVSRVSAETPLRRVAEPSEIKGLALYLASDASSYVTGSVFVIDGGHTA
ncbi:MAG: glucose 1-dehydrogenase [Deltaproteobacteria bacterium]|nr:glucose 1-dehydrogenase [Deltaproteobacteria bacterium]MBW2138824.1 glucose 1-dehydrogenase [Deltaproteobacteria bacterium]